MVNPLYKGVDKERSLSLGQWYRDGNVPVSVIFELNPTRSQDSPLRMERGRDAIKISYVGLVESRFLLSAASV